MSDLRIPCVCCGGDGTMVGWAALRPYRAFYEVKAREVAEALNCHVSLVSQAERGVRKVSKPDWHQRYIATVDRIVRERRSLSA